MRTYNKNKDDIVRNSNLSLDDNSALLPLRVMPAGSAAEQSAPLEDDKQADKQSLRKNEETSKPQSKPQTKGLQKTVNKSSGKKGKQKGENRSRNAEAVKLKGSRGIDTLLRNAYRAQLDMLALAATKANIMISLNGLLMSMLIISGTHLVSINGLYVIPIGIFLVTCACATTFAVFAARPDISRNNYSYNDFVRDDAHLLVFEEFSDLHENEYVDAMTDMLDKPDRVYKNMIAHIYELGVTADRKYRHLYYSYTLFMAGTIITVVSLLTLVALRWSGTLTLI